jgi:pyruvate/2-oxoglutarate dehydrogenase complex dihydrolipoamide acyltransferase (E2) component
MLPAALRKPLWFYVRRNPYWFKDMAGTVAVTSMGMYTSGSAVVIPITPMTLTLSIGSIDKRLVLREGQVSERDVINLNVNVDHAVVDGAPLMRFVHRFKELLLKGISSAMP